MEVTRMSSNRNSDNALVLSDSFAYCTLPGVFGVAPTGVTAAWDSSLHELGWLGETGLGEARANNSTDVFGVNGALIRKIRSNDSRAFKFECLESNALVMGLSRPGSTPGTTGGTADVQTVTISGTGTAGTWSFTAPGVGTINPVYNVSTAALATALSTLYGHTVTVTGTAGSSYVITHPVGVGNVPLATVSHSITGATGIAIVHTTPGVAPITTTSVKAYTGSDIRSFGLEEQFGANITRRVYIDRGEAALTGDITDNHTGLRVFQYEVTAYPVADGTLYLDITNNPAEAV
jgi:hypothetical protein